MEEPRHIGHKVAASVVGFFCGLIFGLFINPIWTARDYWRYGLPRRDYDDYNDDYDPG